MKIIKLLTTDDQAAFEKNDSEKHVCLYEPGSHLLALQFSAHSPLWQQSTRTEAGFPVKLRDFLCKAHVCDRGGGGEKQDREEWWLGRMRGSPSQLLWWAVGKSHFVISDKQDQSILGINVSLELTLETVGLGRKKPRGMFSKTWEGFGGGLLEMWGAMCQRRAIKGNSFQSLSSEPQIFTMPEAKSA